MGGFKRINGHFNMIYKQLKKYRKLEDLTYDELAEKLQLQGINIVRSKNLRY